MIILDQSFASGRYRQEVTAGLPAPYALREPLISADRRSAVPLKPDDPQGRPARTAAHRSVDSECGAGARLLTLNQCRRGRRSESLRTAAPAPRS